MIDLCSTFELYPSPLDKHWLDGPKLALWIRDHHSGLSAQLGGDLRQVERWEKGSPAQLAIADRILTRLGSHIHQMPPDFWIDDPSGRPRREATGRFAQRPARAVGSVA